jgi:hypothetical protein
MRILNIVICVIICLPTAIGQTNKYESCCGDDAKVYTAQGIKIYVPNIITPNGDGINDEFYPISSNMKTGSFAVANFTVYDEAGKIIFFMPGMDIQNPKIWSFTGIASKTPFRPANESNYLYTGRFLYKLTLAISDNKRKEEIIEVSGSACVVRCDADAKIIKSKQKCAFPSQGEAGIYDKNKNSKETSCIE